MGSSPSRSEEAPSRQILKSKSYVKKERPDISMYLEENSSDVEILVKSESGNYRYPCHFAILVKFVPLLAAEARNRENGQTKQIKIDRHKPEVVEQVLRFVYSKPVYPEDWKIAVDIVKMAYECKMKDLIEEMEKFLTNCITLENVCYLLDASVSFTLNDLKEKCQQICRYAGFAILQSRGFSEMPLGTVSLIVSMPDLNVRNELSVFEALWNWAKLECVRQSQPLTETSILNTTFKTVSRFVGFELMTASQKGKLSEDVLIHFCERLSVNLSVDDLPNDMPIAQRRSLTLHPVLFNFGQSLEFKPEDPISNTAQGTHVSCVKFSVNVDTCLLSFVTICLHEEDENPVEKLKISGPDKVLLEWPSTIGDGYITQGETKRRFVSLFDNTKVAETTFTANIVLPLEAGVIYHLEVEPRGSHIKWPLAVPQWEHTKFDRNILLHPEDSVYGLESITFLQTC